MKCLEKGLLRMRVYLWQVISFRWVRFTRCTRLTYTTARKEIAQLHSPPGVGKWSHYTWQVLAAMQMTPKPLNWASLCPHLLDTYRHHKAARSSRNIIFNIDKCLVSPPPSIHYFYFIATYLCSRAEHGVVCRLSTMPQTVTWMAGCCWWAGP